MSNPSAPAEPVDGIGPPRVSGGESSSVDHGRLLRSRRRRSVVPGWARSIKFRLAMTYAVTVYALAVLIIGGIYASQVRELREPVLLERRVALIDVETGAAMPIGSLASTADEQRLFVAVERNSYLRVLDNLKNASLAGLALMVVVAFAVGWVLASVTLRPINRMVAVARDITGTDLSRRIDLKGQDDELTRLADTFDSMLDRLQAAFEDQRRFVQDASHELRNPLATARASLELALTDSGSDAESLRQAATVAHRSTERMADLVDDLLVQARTGVPEITLGEIAFIDLVGDAVDQFQAAARQRSVRLALRHDLVLVEPGPVVTGDESGLYRAISNLLSNAIRHAPAGTVVDVAVTERDGVVEVAVSDSGQGLTDGEKAMVFQRFWTGSDSTEGNGLGLSIVQQIAHRHGGSVRVESLLGQGASFVLQLPTKQQMSNSESFTDGDATPDAGRLGSGATDLDTVVAGAGDLEGLDHG